MQSFSSSAHTAVRERCHFSGFHCLKMACRVRVVLSSYLDVLFPRILIFYGVNSSILDIWSGSAELPVNSYCCVFRNWDKIFVSECDDGGIGLLQAPSKGGVMREVYCLYHHAATAAVNSRLNLGGSARGRLTLIGIAQSSRRAFVVYGCCCTSDIYPDAV